MTEGRVVQVTLPSGNRAVYECHPHYVPLTEVPETADWPILHGKQIAHELGGVWFEPGGWVPVANAHKLAVIMRAEDEGKRRLAEPV